MLLNDMVFDGQFPNMRVDPAWWEPKHPLERLTKMSDPVALWRPAPEDQGSQVDRIQLWATDEEFNILDSGAVTFLLNDEPVTISDTPAQVAFVGALCRANDPTFTSSSPTPVTFALPAGSQAGDLAVVFVTRFNGGNAAADQPSFPAGWRAFQSETGTARNSSLSTAIDNAYPIIAYKELASDSDAPVVTVQNWNNIGGCVYVFRGQWNGAAKIPQVLFSELGNNPDTREQFVVTPTFQEIHQNSVILALSGAYASSFTDSDAFDAVTSDDGHVGSNIIKSQEADFASIWARVYQPSSYTELENLFPRARLNLNGDWTLTNLTIIEPNTASDIQTTRLASTVANARHTFTRSINLVAGQRYTFATYMAGEEWYWLSVNDGSERGWFFNGDSTSDIDNLGSQIGTGATPRVIAKGSAGAIGEMAIRAITFVSAVTGPATFTIGLSSADGVLSEAGSVGNRAYINAVHLYRGGGAQLPINKLLTSGSEITGVNGLAGRYASGVDFGTGAPYEAATFALEIRAASSAPARCRLMEHYAKCGGFLHPSDTLGLRTQMPNADSDTIGYVANKMALPTTWGGPGKYYFEFTINQLDSETSVDSWRVGYADFETAPYGVDPGGAGASFGGMGDTDKSCAIARGASNTIRTIVDTINVDTAGAPYIVGDIIGIAVDFDLSVFRFFRNGVEIGSPRAKLAINKPLYAAFGAGNGTTNTRDFTFNFTGPFGGRKPSGFSAYDFENEVI
jgi:hypothetical protein